MAKNLSELVQEAAGTLPEGWVITLEVELDAGVVTLTDPDGIEHLYPSNRENIEEDFEDAIHYARQKPTSAASE